MGDSQICLVRGREATPALERNNYWLLDEHSRVSDDIVYPSVGLVIDLHEQVVAEGDVTEPGVRSKDAVESALQYISEGFFGEVPETIHEKAVHLMRLLVAEHPFVDGNK